MIELIKEYLIKGHNNADVIEHDILEYKNELLNEWLNYTHKRRIRKMKEMSFEEYNAYIENLKNSYYKNIDIDNYCFYEQNKDDINIEIIIHLDENDYENDIFIFSKLEHIKQQKPYNFQFIDKEKLKRYAEKIFGKYITEKTYFSINGITIKQNIDKYLYDLIDIDNKDLTSLNNFIIEAYNNRVKDLELNEDSLNNFKLLINHLLEWEKIYYSTKNGKKQEKYYALAFKTNKVFGKVLCKANKLYNLGYNNDYIKSINIQGDYLQCYTKHHKHLLNC